MRLFGTAGLVLAVRICGTVLTLAYTLLMVGVASPEEVGHAMAALSAGFLLSVVASLNVEAGSIRFLPLYLEKDRVPDAAGFVIWCRRTVWVTCAALFLPVGAFLLWRHGAGDLGPYLISLIAAPVVAHGRINSRHGVALGLVLRAAVPRMLVRPVFMTTVLGLATWLDLPMSATQIMLTFLAASVIATLLQWLLIRRAMTFRRTVPPRYDDWRDWVPLGLMLSPMLVMNDYLRNLIILTSGLVLAPADVARIGVTLSMISLLNFSLNAVDMVFSPRISRATAQNRPAGRARLLMACGLGKLVVLCTGIPLALLLLPVILPHFGAAYAQVDELFLILAIIPVSKAIFGPTNMMLNVTGHKALLFWGSLFGAGAILLGVLLGHALAGIAGVVAGAALGMLAYQALLYILCRRHTGIDTTALSWWWYRAGHAAP